MKFAHLSDRAVVTISGSEAENFLENIVTCKVVGMDDGTSRFGALLTPQGKIIFDFFIVRRGDTYLFELDENLAPDFIKRMMFYKLRADVKIEATPSVNVYAVWEGQIDAGYPDPRIPEMGQRLIGDTAPDGSIGDYTAHRVGHGVPQGGIDFAYGDAYPHETLMDQSGGVDFRKGCYVGQEVVSRMQHRGTAKKRIIKISAETELPPTGTPVTADGKPAGSLGSVLGNDGLALLRLDRVSKADEIRAGEIIVFPKVQDWVNFILPDEDSSAENV